MGYSYKGENSELDQSNTGGGRATYAAILTPIDSGLIVDDCAAFCRCRYSLIESKRGELWPQRRDELKWRSDTLDCMTK